LAHRHGLRGARVLDAGCGTGKSFLPLLERGFEVTACDGSSAMLDVASAKAGADRVTLHCRDLRQLDPIGEFDLITCLDDVANYLTEPAELAAALAGLAKNLRPGGLLLFDANTLATYRGFFAETAALEQEGLMMVWRGLADAAFGPGRPRARGPGRLLRARRRMVTNHEPPPPAPSPTRDRGRLHRAGRPALPGRVRPGPGRELRRGGRRAPPLESDLPGHAMSPRLARGGGQMLKLEKLEKPVVPAVSIVKGG
jgi:SAM-dependent methyltransferase